MRVRTWFRGAVAAVVVVAGTAVPAPATAVSSRCFDAAAPIPVEEQRLTGAVPDELLRRSGFDRFGPTFRRALCDVRGPRAAEHLVRTSGELLWESAVARVQRRGPAGGDLSRDDDRPLYWARLHLTRALRQWTPRFALTAQQRDALIWSMERSSRGQRDIEFRTGTRRILMSGFDPFTLDSDIRRSNPSGASALYLDGTTVRTPDGLARIEAVVFPVLWTPFDRGMVEHTFLPQLGRIDAFATVSQGRPDRFDLERWNGRWHTGPDNNRESRAGVIPIPAGVPTVEPAPEFVTSTLPFDALLAAPTGRFPVLLNNAVTEIPAGGTVPVVNPNGPTPGSVARAGGGGSYLSNESAYRTTLLRDAVRVKIPGGHIHTPVLQFAPDNTGAVTDPVLVQNRIDIRTQVRALLTLLAGTL